MKEEISNTCSNMCSLRPAQIPGARMPQWLQFLGWSLIFESSQYRTSSTSPFWHLEIYVGPTVFESLWTPAVSYMWKCQAIKLNVSLVSIINWPPCISTVHCIVFPSRWLGTVLIFYVIHLSQIQSHSRERKIPHT